MKKIAFTIFLSYVFLGSVAQQSRMAIPNGSQAISNANNSSGIAIGTNFIDPAAELHVKSAITDRSILLLETDNRAQQNQNGITFYENPDFFIQGLYVDPQIQSQTGIRFSADTEGKLQLGKYNSSRTEQLVVADNLALYRSGGQKIRIELSNNDPRFM